MPAKPKRAMIMDDASSNHPRPPFLWRDRVWTAIAGCFLLLALFDYDQLIPTLQFSASALLGTAPLFYLRSRQLAFSKRPGPKQ
jgi:hypothetical protein